MSTRVFVNEVCAPGAAVTLNRADSRHIALVLRMRAGDPLVVVSAGATWHATLAQVDKDRSTATIIKQSTAASAELPVEVSILQAIPKAAKMDAIVEKVTELGAARIVPLRCERSYGGDSDSKLARWRRIARAAAAQSQRLTVPEVEAPADFPTVMMRFSAQAHVLVAWERAPSASLASALARVDPARAIAIAVGPEGSFTDDELAIARNLNCDIVSLGPTTLRTETAAPAALAAIAALRGWW